MDNSPLVSIIVVSYNHEKYIRENLDSIKRQTYTNIELIVADDASQDNSVEVFEAWLTENNYTAKKKFHKKNTGFATILNECIELTTGKYIKIIAADDYLHESAIEKCILKLEEVGDEYGMIYTDIYAIDDHSKVIDDITDYNGSYSTDPNRFHNLLVIGNRIAALTVIMRKTALLATGKYNQEFIIEDYYRWLKISQLYKVAYVPEKLAFYRLHDSNISKLKADKIKNEDIFLKIMFDENGVAKDIICEYLILERIKNNKKDLKLIEAYKKYPYRNKILVLCLDYNLLPFGYRVLNRLMKLSK